MKKLILGWILALGAATGALAAGGGIPLDKAPKLTNDMAALQNGAKLFVNYCLNCHSASFMRYNRLTALGLGPKGELLILHHSFIPGIGSRIILTIVGDPFFDKAVIGRLSMGPNATVDNFEGVSAIAGPEGSWRIFLLSDDNFNDKQRTLLLAFDWTPPK